MKKSAFIFGFIFIGLQAVVLNAQFALTMVNPNEVVKTEPIDEVQFIVQYQAKMMPDTLKPENIMDESMILKVGAKSSSYYSYTRFVTDSLFTEQIKKSAGGPIRREKSEDHGIVTYQIYKNYPAGKVTTLDKIAMNRFRCEEENEAPVWELRDETMMVLSYSCQKAVCHFKGRDYEAWFTQDIPRSEGPWKLHGLPGLILKAADSQGHYTFECTGLINANEELLFGADGYENISRKNLNRIYERYALDPMGYITSTSPNVKIVIKDESGEDKSVKNMPYNPIERNE